MIIVRSENLQLIHALKELCSCVVAEFGEEYLCNSGQYHMTLIVSTFEKPGFPGCTGALDWAGWKWENFPKALSGLYQGKDKENAVRIECIREADMWIWHLLAGLPG
eukprot:Plantae.Rhodophyta-Rhodochaete_pulchella.ctg54810.p1 GENE.Plantae.Rhodophyta-Rhodochaete_pulchella.ctg54810~~Plantae.Rhodophyta-Rhodochaete_pulchella.ctg54810.p1  ORF type:complete len:107 (+),score=7.53 Plantae.Rhodophyta-Rhodochaete_pulchella.ctg54810:188-508(+)